VAESRKRRKRVREIERIESKVGVVVGVGWVE
jgi:hypothetical protein